MKIMGIYLDFSVDVQHVYKTHNQPKYAYTKEQSRKYSEIIIVITEA